MEYVWGLGFNLPNLPNTEGPILSLETIFSLYFNVIAYSSGSYPITGYLI